MQAILITDCIKHPLTGIGRYALELAKEYEDLNAGVKFIGNCEENFKDFDKKKSSETSTNQSYNYLKKLVKSSSILMKIYSEVRTKLNSRALEKYTKYVIHSPNFHLPKVNAQARVVTVHDLSMFLHPDCFEPAESKFMQSVCENSLNRADEIITVSETVKKEICDYFSYDPGKITVTSLACSQLYRPREKSECENVLNKYGLTPNRYSLFVGTIEPRKNIPTLIYSYRSLSSELREQYPLVIVGHHGWRSELEHRLLQEAKAEGWLYYLDYVSHEDLYYLYSGCRLFCFPTLYEGFGLPVLEAMSSGVAVLCSDLPVMREVCGNGVYYCPAKDVDLWKNNLEKCLLDEELRSRMITQALLKSRDFSWRICANQTIDVYKKYL